MTVGGFDKLDVTTDACAGDLDATLDMIARSPGLLIFRGDDAQPLQFG